jgi:secreted trypsin-like serine protease
MRAKWFIVLLAALAMIWVACGTGTSPDSKSLGQDQDSIINGWAPDKPMHDAVVSLHQRSGDYWYVNIYCSGTLIAPNVVLTAAHCLDEGNRKVNPMEPTDLVVYVGDSPTDDPNPHVYTVAQVLIHPAYNSRTITNDLGLIRLNSSPGVTPVPALPASLGFSSADEGNLNLNFAGFGEDEDGNYDHKLQFDGLLDHIQSAGQIYYYQYEGGPCFGDSGGPAFVMRNGAAYVGGMTSYGDSQCATYGVDTRADAYESWINDFIGVVPEPDCSADGTCNPECAEGADPDCTLPPDCSADGFCNPECVEGADPDCSTPGPVCGDGYCDGGDENCDSCPADCPSLYKHSRMIACCGNGVCERDESKHATCPVDCQ